MKKLYSLLLLSATVISTRALEPYAVQSHLSFPVEAAKVAPKAPARADILGDYTIEYYDLTQITQKLYTSETTIEAGTTENGVVLTIPFLNQGYAFDFQLKGTYSATEGTITFSKGQVAYGADITYYLYNEETQKETVINSVTCYLNDAGGFSFDPNISIGLPAGGNTFYFKAGYFTLYKMAKTDPMAGWTTVGTGQMIDGWLLPGFGFDQNNYRYSVEIQSKDGETGVYRVVNPYGPTSPVKNVNESVDVLGFIEFNVCDPDHVYLYGSNAGFSYSKSGISKFFPCNTLGVILGLNPDVTIEDVLKEYGNRPEWTNATYKDGVVTFPAVEDATAGFINDTNFGIQGAPFGGYGWTESDKKTAKNMEAKIFMPETALEALKVDEEGPVRYFNLQGIEVATPGHGLFIRTQGAKREKVRM